MEAQLKVLMDAAAWQHHVACDEENYKKEKLAECLYNCLKEARECVLELEELNA